MSARVGSEPKFAVCSGTLYTSTFAQQVEACRRSQVRGLGIWEETLGPSSDDEQALELFRNAGLTATFCFPRVPGVIYGDTLFAEPTDRVMRLEVLKSGIRRLAQFDPVAVVCLAGAIRDVARPVALSWVVDGLREAAYVAGEVGVPLALEITRAGPSGSLVRTIPEALDLLERIDVSNISLLVDTWHFWDDPRGVSDIREHIDRVAGVQVNDYPQVCRGWCDRALPGQGVMPLTEIIAGVIEAGFTGWYELEVFSDDGTFGVHYPDSLWRWEAAELVRAGEQAFLNVWQQAAELARAPEK